MCEIASEVNDAWSRLVSDDSDVSWIMCGSKEGEKEKILHFLKEGNGGMPEFIASLPEDDIVWGGFKVMGVDDRGNTVSRRPKFVSVKYLPTTVPTMKRARAGGHKGAIKAVMDAHIDVEIETKDELTEDSIITKLRASGGAHAPTSYEFSDYSK